MVDSTKIDSRVHSPEQRIEIVAERAAIDARNTVTGRVRVRTVTESFDENIDGILTRSDVAVERVAIGREIDDMPATRCEDGVTIIPVVEERLVVERRLFLKEELHVRRITATETVSIPVTVRRQRAIVDRLPPDPSSSDQSAKLPGSTS